MARVEFTALCKAWYKSGIDIPPALAKSGDKEKIAEYINNNISDAPCFDFPEFLEDIPGSVSASDITDISLDEEEV